jgi:chromosome segregation ATPase
MKNLRFLAIGLGVLAVILVVALVIRDQKAKEQKQADDKTIVTFSNTVTTVTAQVNELKQVNVNLETELTTTKTTVTNLNTTLAQKETELLDVQAALKAAKEDVAKRDARIAELETQTQTLEKQAADLTNSIVNLTAQIEDTRNKLAASEGDKAALEKELKRLMGEKAELERKFNDLTILRAQVKKLKTDLTTAKRLEWLRSGVQTTEPKASEKMTRTGAAAKKKSYDLNVEVRSDGSTKVIPPLLEKPAAPASGQPVEMK